jgi:hypothetical protein
MFCVFQAKTQSRSTQQTNENIQGTNYTQLLETHGTH